MILSIAYRLQFLKDSISICIIKELKYVHLILLKYNLYILQLVILTDAPHELQLEVNGWTRKHGKYFISSDARGLFGYIFVDLGEKFRIDDERGEQCKEVTFNV